MDADPQAEISARLLICFGFNFFAFVVSARDGWRQRWSSVCADALFWRGWRLLHGKSRAPWQCVVPHRGPGKGDRQGCVDCTE
jgi:hypothetical protein